MKTSLLLPFPLVVLALTGCPDKSRPADAPPPSSPTLSQRADQAYEKSKAAAIDAKDALTSKLTEWKLTPSDIKTDLQKSGRVVRDKTLAAGEKVGGTLDNARIVTVIKGKYIADRDLSSLKINVDANAGVVTLNGAVASFELAGRAMALALDTHGVTQVIGLLTIEGGETTGTQAVTSTETM